MSVALLKPIVFLDLETTGVNVETDRIVELALIKLYPNGDMLEKSTLINPEISIPQGATDVHGISDADVAGAIKFSDFASILEAWIGDSDLGGYNSDSFDLQLLAYEFKRCGINFPRESASLIDVYKNECRLAPRDLSTVYYKYTGNKLVGAHGALADTRATLDIFVMQSEKDPADSSIKDIEALILGEKLRFDLAGKFYKDKDGLVFWNFGKYYGKSVKSTVSDSYYFDWFYNKSDANSFTKDKLKAYVTQLTNEIANS